MVPNVAKSGHSFKGALAYYLHDKGAQTTERVAWTGTRNLATEDSRLAMRLMIATAQRADDLKAAAGIPTTGRKSTKAVYAYSLAWHPDEAGKIDRAEMMRAAESSLMAIGAEAYQAIIVAHRDEPHPHVHVIVNRVHPDTGKMLVMANDHHRLSAWALAYREARGEHLKYCPARAATAEKRRQNPDREQRRAHVQERFAEQAAQPREPSQGNMLAGLQAEQKERHRQEWKDAGAAYRARRDAIWQERPSFKAIAAQHRAETRPLWSALGKQDWRARREFKTRERSLAGIIGNAMDAVKAKGVEAGRGHLRAIVAHVFNAPARQATFSQARAEAKAALQRELKQQLDARIAAAKAMHAAKLDRARAEYEAAKILLTARQGDERQKIREGWKAFYATRDQAQPQKGRAWPRNASAPATDRSNIWAQAATSQQAQKPNPAMRDIWAGKARPSSSAPRDRGPDRDFGPER